MKLIKPSFEIWEQEPSLEGVFKQIERAGRVCYKSEDKIAEDTAKAFVDRMIASGHGAMLEHGTVYLKIPYGTMDDTGDFSNEPIVSRYIDNPYSVVKNNTVDDYWYVTGNYRVIIENGWLDDLQYLCEPTEYHEKRITVKFVCDRGVSHEFVRHRVFSFAQESTRYCNYSKDKFGKEITCILPPWANIPECTLNDTTSDLEVLMTINEIKEGEPWLLSLLHSERYYFELLGAGWKPQQARAVLPNSLKTELVMTGTIKQWEGFFKLRDAGSAHPQAYELAHPLHEEFIKRGYVTV